MILIKPLDLFMNLVALKKQNNWQKIILTLYVMNYPDDDVVAFLNTHKVSAITMWDYRANKDFVEKLKRVGIFIYVHTVNDPKLKEQFKGLGVDGFYTDYIEPNSKE